MEKLFVDNPDLITDYFKKKFIKKEGKLGVTEINNGIILPPKYFDEPNVRIKEIGGVYDEDFNEVALGIDMGSVHQVGLEKYGITSKDEIKYYDEEVIYGGFMHYFFSWLMLIFLSERLWYVYQNLPLNKKIVFISWNSTITPLQESILELLYKLGIDKNNVIVVNQPSMFKKIIVPDISIEYLLYGETDNYRIEMSDEFLFIYELISKKIPHGKYEKVYLSKTAYKKFPGLNIMIGEEYFEEFYQKKGFKIIYPEQLPLEEQISLMLGANEVVGTLGTQMIFASVMVKPNTKIVYLHKNTISESQHIYMFLCEQRLLQGYFVDVSLNFLMPYKHDDDSVFLLGISDIWTQYVEFTYHEKIKETKEYTFERFGYQYIKSWCKLHGEIRAFNFFLVDFIEPIDFLDNMHKVLFGTALDRTKFNITPSKWQLMNDNAVLTNNINSVSEEKNKLLSEKAALEEKLQTIMGKIKEIEDLCNS